MLICDKIVKPSRSGIYVTDIRTLSKLYFTHIPVLSEFEFNRTGKCLGSIFELTLSKPDIFLVGSFFVNVT